MGSSKESLFELSRPVDDGLEGGQESGILESLKSRVNAGGAKGGGHAPPTTSLWSIEENDDCFGGKPSSEAAAAEDGVLIVD
jgi:hypothetical protein